MKPKSSLAAFLFVITSVITASAQNDTTFIGRAINQLKEYSEKHAAEKVHLQLDKPYYAAGDDIWFKGYVIAGSNHKLSGISGILNVELIDSKDSVKQFIKLPLVNGLTWGDFKLPDTIAAGNYRIRAYTNWMRNAGTAYFYDRIISIGNSIYQKASVGKRHIRVVKSQGTLLPSKPEIAKTDVQFFPESGNLVYGIRSKVAFKAVGSDGLGKDVEGVIIDDQNQQVAQFSSQHLGMGIFYLLPESSKTYKAKVTYQDGYVKTINLPSPVLKGYVMHVNASDSLKIRVTIEPGGELLKDNSYEGIKLIAESAGQVYYAAESKSVNSIFTADIPKSKFPSGIVRFTLFSSTGEPLNERLVFVQNPDHLNLTSSVSGKVFPVRAKIQVNVKAKNKAGEAALGNFSAAVIDETKVPADETAESNIFADLLLTSEIKGYVEKPNYYFTRVNEKTRTDLEVLMLTQGYHRFEWKEILGGEGPAIVYQPETSLQIAGHVKTISGKAVAKGKISLLSSSAGFFMEDTLSDNNGYFAFKNLQFRDSTKFVIQSKPVKGNRITKLELENMPPVLASTNEYLPAQVFKINDSLSVYLSNSKKVYYEEIKNGIGNHSIALKEVKITAAEPVLKNSSNLNGPGNADQVIYFGEKGGIGNTVADCLMGKLHSVSIRLDQFGVARFISRNGLMKIYINGIDLGSQGPEFLNNIPPEIVESVEVLINSGYTAIYGSEAAGGALLINTKYGSFSKIETPNIVAYAPKGYYKAREFYSPQYDNPNTNIQIADLRSTVYWNPNVVTDKDGNASFEYFNTGNKGVYRIIIEGIDENGNLGREVYRYKVE